MVGISFKRIMQGLPFDSRRLLARSYLALVLVMLAVPSLTDVVHVAPSALGAYVSNVVLLGLSLVDLVLRGFIDLSGARGADSVQLAEQPTTLGWMLAALGVFVLSALAVALLAMMARKGDGHGAHATGGKQ